MSEEILEYVDEEELKLAQEKERKRQRDQELEDIKTLAKSAWGKRFFVRLLTDSKVFSSTFSTDQAQAAFLEGHRNLALRYFHDIADVAPEIIPYLMVEGERQADLV